MNEVQATLLAALIGLFGTFLVALLQRGSAGKNVTVRDNFGVVDLGNKSTVVTITLPKEDSTPPRAKSGGADSKNDSDQMLLVITGAIIVGAAVIYVKYQIFVLTIVLSATFLSTFVLGMSLIWARRKNFHLSPALLAQAIVAYGLALLVLISLWCLQDPPGYSGSVE